MATSTTEVLSPLYSVSVTQLIKTRLIKSIYNIVFILCLVLFFKYIIKDVREKSKNPGSYCSASRNKQFRLKNSVQCRDCIVFCHPHFLME